MRKLISLDSNQSKEQFATTLITITTIFLLVGGIALLASGFMPHQTPEQQMASAVLKLAEEKGWDRFAVTDIETGKVVTGGKFPS
jgi:hypothetical protein